MSFPFSGYMAPSARLSKSGESNTDMILEQRNLSQMLETAIVAARLAGQRAMEEIDFIKTVQKKNQEELVTQTDARCQQIIIGRIKEVYPDHGFVADPVCHADARSEILLIRIEPTLAPRAAGLRSGA